MRSGSASCPGAPSTRTFAGNETCGWSLVKHIPTLNSPSGGTYTSTSDCPVTVNHWSAICLIPVQRCSNDVVALGVAGRELRSRPSPTATSILTLLPPIHRATVILTVTSSRYANCCTSVQYATSDSDVQSHRMADGLDYHSNWGMELAVIQLAGIAGSRRVSGINDRACVPGMSSSRSNAADVSPAVACMLTSQGAAALFVSHPLTSNGA
ncbi:hypothetical protein DAEQUDRAFT_201540 [Daedalea quercina L-15889]|uniref:Uncharacterized protein n=1 Tax=Daedalea quercina L-15889 TaxID=1314783 RepID=A0A165UA45_9APHY|nr:hypothetical protein DAEQUDRAFT_201540 [Daedalea quercina L-15889]